MTAVNNIKVKAFLFLRVRDRTTINTPIILWCMQVYNSIQNSHLILLFTWGHPAMTFQTGEMEPDTDVMYFTQKCCDKLTGDLTVEVQWNTL